MRVLAVDDELPALEDLVRLLEASSAVERVESAASAEEALVALGDGAAIDAVFLDVRMPGLGGLELARVLRRFENPPAVVFVSAFDDAAVDAFELAAVDYLRKPVSRRRLDEAIERASRRTPTGRAGDARGRDAGRRRPARWRHPPARAFVGALPAGARRLRARGQHRGPLPGPGPAVGPRGALVGATASCACTAASWSTCGEPSKSGRGSTAPPCWSWPTATRSRSPGARWESCAGS